MIRTSFDKPLEVGNGIELGRPYWHVLNWPKIHQLFYFSTLDDTIKTSSGISSFVADFVQPAAIEELQVMFMYNNVTGIIKNRDQKIKT